MGLGLGRAFHYSLRPTRRDILLCLLTLSFAYLLFSPAPDTIPIPNQAPSSVGKHSPIAAAGGGGGYRLLGLGNLFYGPSDSSSKEYCATPSQSHQETFGESVKPVGFGSLLGGDVGDRRTGLEGVDKNWDGGEEQAEDDELQGMTTILRGHAPGWTLFDKLYIHNGSFYVVT